MQGTYESLWPAGNMALSEWMANYGPPEKGGDSFWVVPRVTHMCDRVVNWDLTAGLVTVPLDFLSGRP